MGLARDMNNEKYHVKQVNLLGLGRTPLECTSGENAVPKNTLVRVTLKCHFYLTSI